MYSPNPWFNEGSLPFNYPGFPIFKGKPKRIHLKPNAPFKINGLEG